MYLPRNLIAHLYQHLLQTHHATSPPILLLVALEPDALCASRILTSLLKRDYIPHKIQPIAGYGDLTEAGDKLVRPMRTTDGGDGGIVICLGVGALVDLEAMFGLEVDENGEGGMGGVEVWILDARRPYNLANVFGGLAALAQDAPNGEVTAKTIGVDRGQVTKSYKPGKGGIIVFDDGDIQEEMESEKEAYCSLAEMPDIGDYEEDSGASDSEGEDDDDAPASGQETGKKRKSWSGQGAETDSEDEDERPSQRRRSNSSSPIPSTPERPQRRGLMSTSLHRRSSDVSRQGSLSRSSEPSPPPAQTQASSRKLRRELLRLRRKHERVLQDYQALGTSFSEPISSMMYSLASELGREDNDLLWNAIVGVSSLELYGRTHKGLGISHLSTQGGSSGWNGDRGERIRGLLRDEVRRLNPIDARDAGRDATMGDSTGVIPTTARSPNDMAIRLSPEPRFLLIRHWSLYDSMLHSPYLSTRLHVWNDAGRRRLHKLLAKMGVSLSQCKQNYTHMDMELKRGLRERLLKFGPVYGLDGLVPPPINSGGGKEGWGFVRCWGWKACLSAIDMGVILGAILEVGDAKEHSHRSDSVMSEEAEGVSSQTNNTEDLEGDSLAREQILSRFWTAYDALANVDLMVSHIGTAQHLHRAILRTGTSLIEKRQIRHLRAFRMAVVKEGPDVQLFTHPGALIKLALWIGEAIGEMEGVKGRRRGGELVMAGLDEKRGVYVVVGLGGGGGIGASKEREKKREERRKERERKREARKEEKAKEREARRERLLANGMEDDDEDEEEETEEESDGSDSDSDGESEESLAKGYGRNRFGNAFHEVIEETGARVKVDSFEHCVVEVKKEDLSGFLESLSMKTVVG